MTDSNHFAKAEMLIRRPAADVFQAFIDPAITTKFWFTHSSGTLEENKTVEWSWEMYGVSAPVHVKQIVPLKTILIEWGAGEHKSTVEWTFLSLGEAKTFLTITNYDFQSTGEGLLSQVRDSTGGFNLLIAGAKAWLEHGIELGLTGDKFPKEMME